MLSGKKLSIFVSVISALSSSFAARRRHRHAASVLHKLLNTLHLQFVTQNFTKDGGGGVFRICPCCLAVDLQSALFSLVT